MLRAGVSWPIVNLDIGSLVRDNGNVATYPKNDSKMLSTFFHRSSLTTALQA